MIDVKLTEKQQRFADEYIKDPNATKAYMAAYPNVKKESTAKVNGSRLLTNANVAAYIEAHMKELASQRIADQTEILEALTDILRGKKKGTALVGVGMGEQEVEQVEPTIAEKIRAAELLGKRYAMWTDKQQVETAAVVEFVDDIGVDSDD